MIFLQADNLEEFIKGGQILKEELRLDNTFPNTTYKDKYKSLSLTKDDVLFLYYDSLKIHNSISTYCNRWFTHVYRVGLTADPRENPKHTIIPVSSYYQYILECALDKLEEKMKK